MTQATGKALQANRPQPLNPFTRHTPFTLASGAPQAFLQGIAARWRRPGTRDTDQWAFLGQPSRYQHAPPLAAGRGVCACRVMDHLLSSFIIAGGAVRGLPMAECHLM